MRTVSQWVRRARELAREFQGGLEDMAREAELDKVKDSLQAELDPDGMVNTIKRDIEDGIESEWPDDETDYDFGDDGRAKADAADDGTEAETVETIESAETAETTETVEAAETVESAEPAETVESAETAETVESVEPVESADAPPETGDEEAVAAKSGSSA